MRTGRGRMEFVLRVSSQMLNSDDANFRKLVPIPV